MKLDLHLKSACLAALAFAAGASPALAQSSYVIASFDNAASVTPWQPWQEWNGSAGVASWAPGPTDDANGSAASGSIKLAINFTGTTNNGGAVVYNLTMDASKYNALEWDAMVDPSSPLDKYGTACDLKVGLQTTSSYHYHATDNNLNPGGWHHFKVAASDLGASEWNQVVQVLIQCYDNNYTNAQTTTIYVDNIKFTGPSATYPNFTSDEWQFNTNVWNPNNAFWNNGQGNIAHRFGDTCTYAWSPNDAQGNSASGSLYIGASVDAAQNCVILDIPFDTNWMVYSAPKTTNDLAAGITNFINGRQYTNIEFDVLWDATNSTISLADFNSIGDVSGFPMAILANNGTNSNYGEYEACGTACPIIPDGYGTNGPNASNTWVHMSCPLNNTAAGIDQVTGVYLKKYDNSSTIGATAGDIAYFYIDNIQFDGAISSPPRPTATISKAVPGLNIITVAGPYGPYERENLITQNTGYSFVDSATPWTYSVSFGSFASTNYVTQATIDFFPTATSPGTDTEADYTDPTLFQITIGRQGAGSYASLHYKFNAANGNGTLYTSNTVFNTASPVEGTWAFTISQNTNCLVVAPDGSSTNLPFPLSLTSSEISSQMAGTAYVEFGAFQNGSGGAGGRFVITNISIANGSSTVLSDNFLTDTSINSTLWNVLPDSGSGNADLYLLGSDTKYFIDWTTIGGPSWQVMTNSTLGTPFGVSASLTSETVLDGSYYHTEVATTNLPPSGNLFFELSKGQ